ncbi:MAG: hypothetical protein A3K19_16910 [Lentisphaerae bacterium RIFOXYB12_FULL_65_16]|nr:MAG: hypothetical protein A3J79_12770 [Elusimicrobia bacterium RIFOXYB2_FULL_62_6]OGV73494.1 MAG: hypothetical protein A3K18_17870 [Lentisphaerae bacterium RIFOXYA12_64_32]OGV88928.1 MAG: hypothetical protein A3K19_16910 [Lentisphaerae bacterium RIFOXYB12_FULL_65_16]
MENLVEAILVGLLISDMTVLASSRVAGCIRVTAMQGLLLGVLTLLLQAEAMSLRVVLMAGIGMLLKGGVFPYLLARAGKEAGVQREVEPFVGYIGSVLLAVAMLVVAVWLGTRLPLQVHAGQTLVVPAAFMTMFTGLFLIVARRKALTQVVGFLVFENGIYAFGVATVGEVPALVELGVLLDAFVAVFVMGIAIYHINREFDHIDTDQLSSLKG